MSSRPIELIVRPRGDPIPNLPSSTYTLPTDSCHDVYLRIAAKSRFPIERLRITKGGDGSALPNDEKTSVESVELYDQSGIFVKDLGPQIAWRTVFIIEYLGPIIFHPLIYLLRGVIFNTPPELSAFPPATAAQTLSCLLITLHFLKREYETIFVHRFSNATMPARNIFKNSAHYWLLAGLNIALFTYTSSQSSPTGQDPPLLPPMLWNSIASLLFVVGEAGNFAAHLHLQSLRPAGTTTRQIPSAWPWQVTGVTCPNYTFETVAWLGILMANRSLSTLLFIVVAVGQMVIWARKKESRYRKEFGSKYGKRKFSMLPGII